MNHPHVRAHATLVTRQVVAEVIDDEITVASIAEILSRLLDEKEELSREEESTLHHARRRAIRATKMRTMMTTQF